MLATTLGWIALLIVAIHVVFPDKPDYAAHFSSGAGMTLGGLSVLLFMRRAPAPLPAVALGIIAVGVGAAAEASVFRLAAFDVADFALQSAGALMATIPFLATPTPARNAVGAVSGFVLVVVGVSHIVWINHV